MSLVLELVVTLFIRFSVIYKITMIINIKFTVNECIMSENILCS